ncbi:MAG: hypothetical protein ACHQT7_01015 [Candidatus Levyibacteriota bacterium]
MSAKVKFFIPFAVVIALLSGLIYVAGQQILRIGANDPQIQFAQDIASSLNSGNALQAVIPPSRVDMVNSLAAFVMVFDNTGALTLSTGEINGKEPPVPAGVFDYVSKNGEDRFTWQPQTGVRNAVVVTKYKNGYVLVGRSLKEVEKREDNLLKMVILGGVVTMIATYASILLLSPKQKK